MLKKLIPFLIFIMVTIGFIYIRQANHATKNPIASTANPKADQNDTPRIVSTKPDPLDNGIISATQVIEITFNRPLQNVPEFRVKIGPDAVFKVELSTDRKTAKIIPTKPYALGTTYNLYIGPETKFDGVGNWGEDKTFQFQTIKYNGV